MDKFGINNVRGGSYVSVNLEDHVVAQLKQMSLTATNKCYVCAGSGHYANECPHNLECETESEEECIYICEYCDKEFDDEPSCYRHELKCKTKQNYSVTCYRCGRTGHYAPDCYASKHVRGYSL